MCLDEYVKILILQLINAKFLSLTKSLEIASQKPKEGSRGTIIYQISLFLYSNILLISVAFFFPDKPFASITNCPQHDIRYHVMEGSDAHMRTKIDAFPDVTSTSWYWKNIPITSVLTNSSSKYTARVFKVRSNGTI